MNIVKHLILAYEENLLSCHIFMSQNTIKQLFQKLKVSQQLNNSEFYQTTFTNMQDFFPQMNNSMESCLLEKFTFYFQNQSYFTIAGSGPQKAMIMVQLHTFSISAGLAATVNPNNPLSVQLTLSPLTCKYVKKRKII